MTHTVEELRARMRAREEYGVWNTARDARLLHEAIRENGSVRQRLTHAAAEWALLGLAWAVGAAPFLAMAYRLVTP